MIINEMKVFDNVINYAQKFQEDNIWLKKANELINDKEGMTDLLEKVKSYFNKKEFSKVSDSLKLVITYVKDCVTGKYKMFSMVKLTLALASIIYIVTPLDFLSDFTPLIGFTDDIAIFSYDTKKSRRKSKDMLPLKIIQPEFLQLRECFLLIILA